jgi:hypothetical protein
MHDPTRVFEIVSAAKALAREYYSLTGRPLGITGDIAEVEAIRALGLEAAEVRQPGYDATRRNADGSLARFQIKGRCCPPGTTTGQRVGSIRLDHEWDAVLLVLLDQHFELIEIHEASRAAVENALARPGSVARNERGALGVQAFKRIGHLVWPEEIPKMPQDQATGAAGNAFGRTTAPRIAEAIGATMQGSTSNQARWNGRRIVIKCARAATTSVGVTYRMLSELDAIVAAFQRTDGQFDLFEMSPDTFRTHSRDSRSTGASGRVGLVTRSTFRDFGKPLRTVRIA